MACSVASEPCQLQRRCVCRLSLERRRGGHGTGCSVGMVAIRIGKVARWRCQVWVTASGMVAMLIGEACSVASEPLLLQRWCVCRLSLERRRGGHGSGCSVGTVAIRIGEVARWWCQG